MHRRRARGLAPARSRGSGRAGHAEEVWHLGCAVHTTAYQREQVCFLAAVQSRLLGRTGGPWPWPPSCPPGAEADESSSSWATMARTLSGRRPTASVGSGPIRPVRADLTGGALVGDRPGVRQGAGETVELGDHQGVAGPARSERLAKSRPLAAGAGQAVVNIDPLGGTPRAARPSRWTVRPWVSVKHRAYPTSSALVAHLLDWPARNGLLVPDRSVPAAASAVVHYG